MRVVAWGLLATVLFYQTQFLSGFDTFFGNRSDSRFILYLCEHWLQVFSGKASWLSPAIFYPVEGVLGRSDMALGLALPYSILRLLGLDLFAAMQVTMLVLLLLAFLLAYGLLHRVVGLSRAAALFGAAFFAINSPKLCLSYHLQLQFVAPLPVIFGGVLLAAREPRASRATLYLSAAGLAWALLLMTSFYLGWFCLFWGGLWALLALVSGHLPSRRQLVPALLAWGVTLLALAPLLRAYLPVLRSQGAFPSWECLTPRLWSPLLMGDGNFWWGWLPEGVLGPARPAGWEECLTGLGLVTSLAWLALTVWALRSLDSRHWPVALTILTTTLIYVLNMDYAGFSPWSYVNRYFPTAAAIRVPARWMVFLGLPMALALSWAVDHLRWRRLALLLAALALLEQLGSVGGYSLRSERAYLAALATRVPRDSTAFYVAAPATDGRPDSEHQTDAMLVSVMTGVPTLNGWTSRALRDWFLREVGSPRYEAIVKGWIGIHGLPGPIYRLELSPRVESFTSRT